MSLRLLLLAAALSGASAFGQAPAVQYGPLCDPCVPPAVKKSLPADHVPSQGAALRADVEARLRAPFDAAARDGVLTREQAQAAGLGFIARNFDAIDRKGAGAITFEDYKRFLKERGAAMD
jgi:hypothetical protein